MSRSVLVLALCVLALAFAVHAQKNDGLKISGYPQPTHLRQFFSGDALKSAFCIEDGTDGLVQGDNDPKNEGQLFQRCYGAQIRWGPSGRQGVGQVITAGLIGNKHASIQSLGTEEDIYKRYGDQRIPRNFNVFQSIVFQADEAAPFLIGKNVAEGKMERTPLLTEDWRKLNQTSLDSYGVVAKDTIYIARVSEGPSKSVLSDNDLVIKLQIVSLEPQVLRWSVLAHKSSLVVPGVPSISLPGFASEEAADSAKTLALVSLVVASLAIIVAIVIFTKIRKVAQALAAIPSNDAYYSAN